MRRVVINMQNKLFGLAISDTLRRSDLELAPYVVDSADRVAEECRWISPFALLMEVTSYTPCKLCERMPLLDSIKAIHPGCKIVFVVDEIADKELARLVKSAKKDGLIDQFIYGSISPYYLADIMDSL